MRGSCLCGTIEYQIDPPFKVFQYCHCSRCRKFSGSAMAANLFVPPQQFKWLSGEHALGRFDHPEAKYFATCFCKVCGSSMPWPVQGGKNVVIPAGTLDDDPQFKPLQNIFYKSRACWFLDPDELPQYDELPER